MTNMEMTKWERARRDNSKLLDIKYFTQCLGKIHLYLSNLTESEDRHGISIISYTTLCL